ncbi:4Fe-4S dicluster domain-containing protein [Methanobacterium sp. CWC-01]|uniref:4Fe-4S binding protein n=1 Tax=Methanobacterium aridiramus TaxID=2584467 RepID=UPI002577D215|nr:4Fe-4S binding protein [Methanobacterium sp. CWC-01]WJI09658.1 4Fe-4S dicluster domain-containing protein [Methanobacterium sp. CWC-01]
MFLTTKKCKGSGECIEECPTGAIRLINGKAFSCITCGVCADVCPNKAIFKNKYGGYVVDRAKCNACGVCELSCPVNNITIEDGVVKGICSRCGICVPSCPEKARVDAYDVIEDRQLKFLESLNLTVQPPLRSKKEKELAQRTSLVTDAEKCTLCRRCEYYCPTGAILVDVEPTGKCTECRVCEDVCPVGAIENCTIDPEKCTACLKCVGECPNQAIYIEDFQVKINKLEPEEQITGKLISCLNCGLCADACPQGALKMVNGHLRYDPNLCEDCETMDCLDACPVGTLRLSNDPERKIEGFCVSCGKCVKSCDLNEARSFQQVTWDGSVSDDCISCGICAETCPKDAITLRRGTIDVDLEKCVLCENCAIHCPVEAIPTTTMRRKSIKEGFTFVQDKLCMNCKLCAKICPEDAIKEEDGRMVVDESKCTYCGACSNACPARAILFEREFEVEP